MFYLGMASSAFVPGHGMVTKVTKVTKGLVTKGRVLGDDVLCVRVRVRRGLGQPIINEIGVETSLIWMRGVF